MTNTGAAQDVQAENKCDLLPPPLRPLPHILYRDAMLLRPNPRPL